MKNYLNREEQARHLVLTMAMVQAQDLLKSDGVTADEKKILRQVVDKVEKFNQSVIGRLGKGYATTLANKAKDNTFVMTPRGGSNKGNLKEEIDESILRDIVDDNFNLTCINCKREDCTACGIYRIKSYLNYDGESENNNLCPFRRVDEMLEYNFDD